MSNVTNASGTYTQDPVLFPNMSSGVILEQPVANQVVSLIQLQQAAAYDADFASASSSQARLFVPSTTSGDGITWTAVPVGAAGNLIKIVQNAPSGGSSTAAITTVGGYTVVTISPMSAETNSGLITAIATTVAAYITGVATGGADAVKSFASAALVGGAGVVTPSASFNFLYGGQLLCFVYNRPVVLGAQVIAALLAAGMPITY